MKESKIQILIFCIMGVMLLAGCAQNPDLNSTDKSENVKENSVEDDGKEEGRDGSENESGKDMSSDEDKTDKEALPDSEAKADQDAETDIDQDSEEENPFDGGPDWVTLADEFILPTDRMCLEDAVEKYSITLFDGGKYHDYEGDIGDVIPEYKDRDLDGDHKPDVIRREGSHYVFELTRKGTFKTDDYSVSPNEGEVIQFKDLGCRNFDEIEVVHYTFGTGGTGVSDTVVYSWQDGEWRAFPVIDKDGVVNSSELKRLIAKETGKPYEAGSVRVADIHMQSLLLDLGSKDGPSQTTDYRTAYLNMNFFPQYLVEGDYGCYEIDSDSALIREWPYEVTGDPVVLDGDLQRKLNLYLSNFSEQGFEKMSFDDRTWPYAYAHFVLEWCKVNEPSSVKYSDDRNGVDSNKMQELLDRFFGTNFEEGDYYDLGVDNPYNGSVEYENDKTLYYEPAADGEMFKYNSFTVVTDAQRIKGQYDSFLRLPFKIYRLDAEEYETSGINRKYYSLSAAEAEKLATSGKLHPATEGIAFLSEVGEDRSKGGYWLITYNLSGE
ncbi:MAG: hypothetical protein K6G42_01060 [Lachnospiraceae bacterium]|nr:hypothetical protein [Lachnospiraceae bacterium]